MGDEYSRTGLLAANKISFYNHNTRAWERLNVSTLDKYLITGPAPVIMRPFACIYNPFPYRCSVLCNHPADVDMRNGLSRPFEKLEDLRSLRSEQLEDRMSTNYERRSFMNVPTMRDDWVPEELFRKYTETDSKPQSPAPTLASVETLKYSSNKRSSTAHHSKDNKTHLVLDLRRRRSHSQETLSWREMVTTVPLLPAPVPEKRASLALPSPLPRQQRKIPVRAPVSTANSGPQETRKEAAPQVVLAAPEVVLEPEEPLVGTPRRRGKRRGRAKSRGFSPVKDFQHLEEHGETQISKGGDADDGAEGEALADAPTENKDLISEAPLKQQEHSPKTSTAATKENLSTFLTEKIIQHLQRGLDWHVIESEFDTKRQVALKEANRAQCGISKLFDPSKINNPFESNVPNLWVTVPRSFTRKSARFELPMDSRKLSTLTPIEYAKSYVQVSTGRKLLYGEVFKKFSDESGIENEAASIKLQALPASLNEVMGQELSAEVLARLFALLGIEQSAAALSTPVDFRTFCGLCAIAERVLGAEWGLLHAEQSDPRHLVEQVDFQQLHEKFRKINNDHLVLVKLLTVIQSA